VFGEEARQGMLKLSHMSEETERPRSNLTNIEGNFGWRIYHLDRHRWWVRDQLCGFAQATMYVWFVSTRRLATNGASYFEQSALKLIVDRLLFEHQYNDASEPHNRVVIYFMTNSSSADDLSVILNAQSKAREVLSEAGISQPYHVKLCLSGSGDEAFTRAIHERVQQIKPTSSRRLYPHLFVDDWVIIPPGDVVGETGEEWHQAYPFSMSQTLITQSLYQGIMGTPSPIRNGPLFPATGTSWLDAIQFCNQLSEVLDLPPYYKINQRVAQVTVPDPDGLGVRLPTRAEWCYAACGGHSWPYSGSDLVEEVAWSAHNSGSKVHPVARLKHNNFGLYDMSGNLWEWCHEGPQDAERELICVGDHHPKWLLGGSWANHPWVFPIGETLTELPGYRDEFMGFRVVRNLSPSELSANQTDQAKPNAPSQPQGQTEKEPENKLDPSQKNIGQIKSPHAIPPTSLTSAECFSWWVVHPDQPQKQHQDEHQASENPQDSDEQSMSHDTSSEAVTNDS